MFTTIMPRSIVLTAVFSLFLSSAAANAGKPSGGTPRPTPQPVKASQPVKTSTKFSSPVGMKTASGQKFQGGNHHSRDFHGWSRSCYFPAYACSGYYDPTTDTWYYWYQPGNCYLPVTDMGTYPPVNDGSDPSLPPGATSGPP